LIVRAILIVAVAVLSACDTSSSSDLPDNGLADRQLAWCLDKPGAIGSVARDGGGSIPADAQAVVDDGIYEHGHRWRYHDAWDPDTYERLCSEAYTQFGGEDDTVDMSVLEANADSVAPEPTANLGTTELRQRAQQLMPSLEAAGVALITALGAGEIAAIEAAAQSVSDIAQPEIDALSGAVAEACYTDAGAAYGMAIFNWDIAAGYVRRYLLEPDPRLLELAADSARDAAESGAEWRRLDASAC
jgi:hypothetical protein